MEENKTSVLEGKKILWVEDDDFLAGMIAKKLLSIGVEFERATDGESALNNVNTNKPDIIMLDIMLPGISGIEVLQKIKENQDTKNIPVVMLSNLSQSDDLEKAKELGASKFLVKASMTLDEIVSEMENILK